jgi:hypothetical protein
MIKVPEVLAVLEAPINSNKTIATITTEAAT